MRRMLAPAAILLVVVTVCTFYLQNAAHHKGVLS
jgi:hypothetical protein